MFKLRDYQQQAVELATDYMKSSLEPCVLELATGAGKSLIIAAMAKWFANFTGKRVLCLQPSKELTEQNHAKMIALGEPASFYSASIGKCLANSIVFGTPISVLNSIDQFSGEFGLIAIDECHQTTPTIKKIIEKIRDKNPSLRVIGLTGTPYRLNTGRIYSIDENGSAIDAAIDPYFKKLLVRVTARELIEAGYLTPATVVSGHGYKTSHLTPNRLGKFAQSEVDKATLGHGRLTSEIVGQIVEAAHNRNSVLIFATTRKHAGEVMASLPGELSASVDSGTPAKERAEILESFKAQKIKYLVNISVLTVGFDSPSVDVVAILRPTESASLLQQMIGRGLRLHADKQDCLILDYAENIKRHCPSGDLFDPSIKIQEEAEASEEIDIVCPECSGVNRVKAIGEKGGYCWAEMNKNGWMTYNGELIKEAGHLVPGHHARRCGHSTSGIRCSHRWSSKVCEECDFLNDIAARRCKQCKAELIDPNDKLIILAAEKEKERKRAEFLADETNARCEVVEGVIFTKHVSASGSESLKARYTTPERRFTTWYHTNSAAYEDLIDWAESSCCDLENRFAADDGFEAVEEMKDRKDIDEYIEKFGEIEWLQCVTYKKVGKFWRVTEHN